MNKFLLLLKVMLKSDDIMGLNINSGKIPAWVKYLGFGILLLFISGSVSTIIVPMYDFLKPLGMDFLILKAVLLMASVLSSFLAFLYILNAFYFSKDNENYLSLPVNSGTVITAKLASVILFETASAVLLFYPAACVYGSISGKGIFYYLTSLLAVISIPIIPLSVIGIIMMVIMKFSDFFRNKERFQMISTMTAIVMAVGFNLLMPRIIMAAESGYLPSFLTGDGITGKALSFLFPGAMLLEEGIRKPSEFPVKFLITAAMTAVTILIFYYTGQKFWAEGAQGMTESASTGKVLKDSDIKRASESSSPLISLMMKEIRYLIRTPAYLMNGVLGVALLPLLLIFPLLTGGEELRSLLSGLDLSGTGFPPVLFITTAVMFMYAAANQLTTTAISREGDNLYFMKYIPVKYRTQITAKILPVFIILIVIFIPSAVIFSHTFSINRSYMLISYLTGIPLMFSGLLLSIIPDIIKPNITWTNETKAVKQNFNSFLAMILAAVYGAVLYLLYRLGLPFNYITAVHIILSSAIGTVIFLTLNRICGKYLP